MSEYRPSVAVYGGTNLDIQAHCHGVYRPADSNPGHSSMSVGGVGRNIAVNLAKLGVKTELVTVFGNDDTAGYLAESCRAAGVEVGSSLVLPEEPSPRYVCILDGDGTLVGAVAAMDALEKFGPDELARRYGPGDRADLVIIDANLPEDTIVAAVTRWRDKPLMLDTVSVAKASRAAPVAGGFSIVKPNRAEARALLGLEPDAEGDALSTARSLLALGVREVYLSMGAAGLLWASGDRAGVVLPVSMPVVNVSGAGDAATAALAWATVSGVDCQEKAALAVAAASLCVAQASTVGDDMSVDSLAKLARGVHHERIA